MNKTITVTEAEYQRLLTVFACHIDLSLTAALRKAAAEHNYTQVASITEQMGKDKALFEKLLSS